MKPLYLFLIALFVSACAESIQYISPGYKGQKIQNASLVVVKLQGSVTIRNWDDYMDNFGGGNASDTIANLLYAEMIPALEKVTTFQDIQIADYEPRPEFEIRTYYVSERDSFEMQVPKEQAFNFLTRFADFVLFIDRFETWRDYEVGDRAKNRVLGYGVRYVLVDTKTDQIVAYGIAMGRNVVNFSITRDTWIDNVENLMSNIFKSTPFKKPMRIPKASR